MARAATSSWDCRLFVSPPQRYRPVRQARGTSSVALWNRGNGPLGEGNLISGNGDHGIAVIGPHATNTTITGNFIGTDITGTAAMGNHGFGIFVCGSPNNRIGGSGPEEGNIISGNSSYGIEVVGSGSAGNSISGNYIGVDASGTKELSNGWSEGQP